VSGTVAHLSGHHACLLKLRGGIVPCAEDAYGMGTSDGQSQVRDARRRGKAETRVNVGDPGREGESNRMGRRDGKRSLLANLSDRESQDGEEDILVELPRLLESCFG
jgi:hypothetical protein